MMEPVGEIFDGIEKGGTCFVVKIRGWKMFFWGEKNDVTTFGVPTQQFLECFI